MDGATSEEDASAHAVDARASSGSGDGSDASASPRRGATIDKGQGVQVGSGNVQHNTYTTIKSPGRAGAWGAAAAGVGVVVAALIAGLSMLGPGGTTSSASQPPAVTPTGPAVPSHPASATAVTPTGPALPSQPASATATVTRAFQAVVTSGSATATSCQPRQQSEQAFVATTPAATPTREGDILVYPDPGGSSPVGITKGPDGAMWYVNASPNYSIGRITAGGAITHYRAAAGLVRPFGIAAGPDGALWFTGAGSIGRITTAGGVTPFTFFTGACIGSADWIAAGPDGALWFTTGLGGAGAIGRITTSGTVTTYADPGVDAPTGITAGPDGALWFVNSASRANPGTGSIGRITTAGVAGNYTFPGIRNLSGITAGPGGTLWFTGIDPQQAESVYKMTTSGAVTEYVKPGLGHVGGSYLGNGGGIVQGPDDAMWFTDYGGTPSAIIGRLSAATGAFTPYDTPGWVIAANEIASGPGNALWFTMGARGIARLPAPALTPVPS
jgi:streptogramin lyase